MPFSAPERSGVSAFAVWAWWWWLFHQRACWRSCWLWLQMSLLRSFELPQVPGGHLRMQHCTAALLAFLLASQPICLMSASFVGPSNVRLVLHTGLSSPVLPLLLLALPSSCSFFITGPLRHCILSSAPGGDPQKTLSFPVFFFTASKK